MTNKMLKNYRWDFAVNYDSLYRWVDTYEEDGIIYPGYPLYSRNLLRFINDVYDSGLLLSNYEELLKTSGAKDVDTLINTADITLLRAILTYYVRGEHSNNGLWGRGVRKKCFLRIIDRLLVLLNAA